MLINVVELLLVVCAALLAVPVTVFSVQMFMSISPRPRPVSVGQLPIPDDRPPIAVIVPAHNESSAIGKTIATILTQLTDKDRLLVVADNCSDDTAIQASRHGATVVERHNLKLRGKGYALDHGWKTLIADGRTYELFACIDADCIVHAGALTALADTVRKSGRPAQAMYLIFNENDVASVRQRISEFAYIINSHARPLGFARLGLPCQLVGSGMMFPKFCLESTSLASGHLVEDLQLGLTLASKGSSPVFCEQAYVTSTFPTDKSSQEVQRTRWEHGRLSIMTQTLPKLIWRSILTLDKNLFAQALDAAVPPLTLLLLSQVLLSAIAGGFYVMYDVILPASIAAIFTLLLILALIISWHQYGRDTLKGRDLVQGALYVFWKIPLYVRYLIARQTEWVRTSRGTKDK